MSDQTFVVKVNTLNFDSQKIIIPSEKIQQNNNPYFDDTNTIKMINEYLDNKYKKIMKKIIKKI